MPRKTTSLRYRNLHGQPLGGAGDLGRTVKRAAARRQEGDAAVGLTEAEVDRVFDALALAGWRRGKTALMNLMRVLDLRRDGGRAFDNAEIAAALRRLHAAGRVQTVEGEGWYVPEALAEARLAALLVTIDAGAAWRALVWAAGGACGQVHPVPTYFSPRGDEEAVAVLRLVLVSGIDAPAYASLSAGALRQANVSRVVSTVLAQLQRSACSSVSTRRCAGGCWPCPSLRRGRPCARTWASGAALRPRVCCSGIRWR
ncbi:MAG: hypothetical protein JSR59_19630 [Proteobacteria bacterium]|nr:hypothetical protein [Pseudomonadota bacterium]